MKTIYSIVLALFICGICNAQIITTIAGNGTPGFSGEGGPATNAEFDFPAGIVSDKWRNIYVADFYRSVIQKIDTNGILTRFSGNGFTGYSGDGGAATAASLQLYYVTGLATDTIGNVYISCGQTVRKVSTAGIITTVAGTGVYGYSGDGGPAIAAEFMSVTGLCFDNAGNFYIADEQSNNIRMVNTAGIISTIAGTTIGFSGDGGPATNAQLKWPSGIAIDDSGNKYIADFYNSRIRKINTAGIITTIAGGAGSFGDKVCTGCPATNMKLSGLTGIAVDQYGNIIASCTGDDAIHKITKDGTAYTITGTGMEGFAGDGGPASVAQLHNPGMICMDKAGNLLIVDKSNARYRKVWYGTTHVPPVNPGSLGLLVYPNPVNHKTFSYVVFTDTNGAAQLQVADGLGRVVLTTSCVTNNAADISLNVPAGLYFVTAITKQKKMTAKLVVE